MKSSEFLKLSKEEQKQIPFKDKPFSLKLFTVIFLALIIALPITCLRSGCNSLDETGLQLNAQRVAERVVKGYLKSPGSAEFPTEEQRFAINESAKIITVTGAVDSQNGFGALIRSRYALKLRWPDGDIHKLDNWEILDTKVY